MVQATIEETRHASQLASMATGLERAMATLVRVTETLGARGMAGEVDAMLAHSYDYLDMTMTLVTGWLWLRQAEAATRALDDASDADRDFYRGKLQTALYWFANEVPRIEVLAGACLDDTSYVRMRDAWL